MHSFGTGDTCRVRDNMEYGCGWDIAVYDLLSKICTEILVCRYVGVGYDFIGVNLGSALY